MENNGIIKFGIFEESSHVHDTTSISSACFIDNDSFVIATLSKTITMNKSSILESVSMQFSHILYIEKYNTIVAVSSHSSNLFIFPAHDMSRPYISNYPTAQHIISFLLYSPKSEAIITIGEKIRVFYLKVSQNSKLMRPTVIIESTFTFKSMFNLSGCNSIGFDTNEEILFLPSPEGIYTYSIKGESLSRIARLTTNMSTVYAYTNNPKELLVSDPTNGLSLWSSIGTLVQRIPYDGSSIITMEFIDDENVLILDDKNVFFIVNIRSKRSMIGYISERRPSNIFLLKSHTPLLIISYENSFDVMSIRIPWKVWELNVIRPIFTGIVPKPDHLPRFLVHTKNSFVKIFSPKDGRQLTAATPSYAAFPISVFYDRGCLIHYHKDQFNTYTAEPILIDPSRELLLMLLDNNHIALFDSLYSPSKEIRAIPVKAESIRYCVYENEWCYAIHKEIGDISILDYDAFELKENFHLSNSTIRNFFYYHPKPSFVVEFDREIVLFDLELRKITSRISISIKSTYSELFSDSLYIGDINGSINKFDINPELGLVRDTIEINGHQEAVSSLSFSLEYMVSTSFDGSVVIWDYSFNKIFQIKCPLSIFSSCFLNGCRDLILGTESELMIMKGDSLFKGSKDHENKLIDNFLHNPDVQPPLLPIAVSKTNLNKPKRRTNRLKEKIENFKLTLENMNKEQQLKNVEAQETPKKKEHDETTRKRIVEQMYLLTMNSKTEELPIPPKETVIVEPPVVETINQSQHQSRSNSVNQSRSNSVNRSRSSSKASKQPDPVDEESIKNAGKGFIKRSLIKDEKSRIRNQNRQQKKKEKEEKLKQKQLLEEMMKKKMENEKEKTETDLLLESMDGTLKILELPEPKEEVEPEIYFKPPSEEPINPIRPRRPIRRNPFQFQSILDPPKSQNAEENSVETIQEKKLKKRKKKLKKRLTRAPTPPGIREEYINTKVKKKTRSKTPPLTALPEVVSYNKFDPVFDKEVVRELFSPKDNKKKSLNFDVKPPEPKTNDTISRPKRNTGIQQQQPIKSDDIQETKIETNVQVQQIPNDVILKQEIVQTSTNIVDEIEEGKPIYLNPVNQIHNLTPPKAFKPQPPQQPKGHFITASKTSNETKDKDEETELRIPKKYFNERKKYNFKAIEKKLSDLERKINEQNEMDEKDPLAWRGVPPKLERMRVRDIDIFHDDEEDHYVNQNIFFNNQHLKLKNTNIRIRSSNSSFITDSSSNFSSNWNPNKIEERRRNKSSRRSKVSRVDKKKPWV